ncbi:hypothetical protein BHE74_00046966 [Ensete ventricosum]|nr:hypothetical protein BHE74_00046966 [Ensete ventricosum]
MSPTPVAYRTPAAERGQGSRKSLRSSSPSIHFGRCCCTCAGLSLESPDSASPNILSDSAFKADYIFYQGGAMAEVVVMVEGAPIRKKEAIGVLARVRYLHPVYHTCRFYSLVDGHARSFETRVKQSSWVMERLGDDELGLVLRSVDRWRDRKSCARVCRRWRRVEALTRAVLRVLDPHYLPRFLPRFPNLTALEAATPISDPDLDLIARSCPVLESLNLNARRSRIELDEEPHGVEPRDVTDAGLCAIAFCCRKLKNISLRRRKGVGDVGAIELAKHAKGLSSLDLSWCSKVTDRAVGAFCAFSSLMVLCLRGCPLLSDSGLACLATGPLSRSLRVLDLSECDQITDLGVCLLRHIRCLEELSLADCGPKITDVGGIAIASIVSLRRLDLSWLINLSDATHFALARNCSNMDEINVTGCELVTGAGILSHSNHPALKILVLTSCYGVSAHDVEQMMLSCRSLRYVGLDKSLRGWMPSSVQEKLSHICRIDWL